MREQVLHFPYGSRMVSALMYYGDNDLVQYWELLSGKLNLSKMTYVQVREMTGLTEEDIKKISAAIQLHIDMKERRR